jgi:hypothetical protein
LVASSHGIECNGLSRCSGLSLIASALPWARPFVFFARIAIAIVNTKRDRSLQLHLLSVIDIGVPILYVRIDRGFVVPMAFASVALSLCDVLASIVH